jgi:hypothetical protein
MGTTSQPPLRSGSGASCRLDARALAGLFRIALVAAGIPSPGTDTCFVDYFNKLE